MSKPTVVPGNYLEPSLTNVSRINSPQVGIYCDTTSPNGTVSRQVVRVGAGNMKYYCKSNKQSLDLNQLTQVV